MINQFRNRHFYFMLLADAGLFAASMLLAYLLRFDFAPAARYWTQTLFLILLAIPVKGGCFFFFGLYRGMWRYTDLYDFWRIFQAALISSLILVSIVLFAYRFQGYPRSVFFIDGILTFVFSGGLRILIRTVYRSRENLRSGLMIPGLTKQKRKAGVTRVIIAGAGDAGEKILREILENPQLRYDVIGFLDDNADKKNRSVHSVPVLGSTHELPELAEGSRVDQVFIAMPSASGSDMRRILEICKLSGVNFKTDRKSVV